MNFISEIGGLLSNHQGQQVHSEIYSQQYIPEKHESSWTHEGTRCTTSDPCI
jgi:hypothetical protein